MDEAGTNINKDLWKIFNDPSWKFKSDLYQKNGTNNNYLIIVHDMFVSVEMRRLLKSRININEDLWKILDLWKFKSDLYQNWNQ